MVCTSLTFQVVFKNKCLVATDIQVDRFSKKSLEGLPIETDIFSIKLSNISNTSKLRYVKQYVKTFYLFFVEELYSTIQDYFYWFGICQSGIELE